jgi:hypothetical protein
MREELLGYLLGALEPDEERDIEARLAADPQLRRELEELRPLVRPLAAEDGFIDPPAGLANRVCRRVEDLRRREAAVGTPVAGVVSRADVVTVFGIVAVATIIVGPMVVSSRHNAQVRACQERMQTTGRSLIDYSRVNGGYFPEVPTEGPLAHAGIFVARLHDEGYLHDVNSAFCPTASFDGCQDRADCELVPALKTLETCGESEAELLFAGLSGLFGYAFGYSEEGRYRRLRNRDRARFAVLADAPERGSTQACGLTRNHAGGQNVWFEDGHVEFVKSGRVPGSDDHLFENHLGFVGAGIGPDDVVIGSASATPRLQAR